MSTETSDRFQTERLPHWQALQRARHERRAARLKAMEEAPRLARERAEAYARSCVELGRAHGAAYPHGPYAAADVPLFLGDIGIRYLRDRAGHLLDFAQRRGEKAYPAENLYAINFLEALRAEAGRLAAERAAAEEARAQAEREAAERGREALVLAEAERIRARGK